MPLLRPAAISAAYAADNSIHVVGLGGDNNCYHTTLERDTDWNTPSKKWDIIGGPFLKTPAIIAHPFEHRVDIFTVDADNKCVWRSWVRRRDENAWSENFESLGGQLKSRISAIWSSFTQLDLFAVGTDNQCLTASIKWTSGTARPVFDGLPQAQPFEDERNHVVSPWTNLRGNFAGGIAAVTYFPIRDRGLDGEINIFAVGINNQCYHMRSISGDWQGWESLGGSFFGSVSAQFDGSGLHVFGIDNHNLMCHKLLKGTFWTPPYRDWETIESGSKRFISIPHIMLAGLMTVFVIDQNNQLIHMAWDRSEQVSLSHDGERGLMLPVGHAASIPTVLNLHSPEICVIATDYGNLPRFKTYRIEPGIQERLVLHAISKDWIGLDGAMIPT